MSNTKSQQLTIENAELLAGALHSLQQLRNKGPVEKGNDDDQQINALVEYIAPRLLEHADEFLGCWFAVKNEYAPLVQALAPVVRRVLPQQITNNGAGILFPRSQREADDAAQLKSAPPSVDNINNDAK